MTRAHLAAAAAGVQVGTALVASQAVVTETGAGALGLARYAIASLVVAPVALAARGEAVQRRDLLPLVLIGIGQFGVLIALLNLAVVHASSAQVALVFATLPLATVAVAWALERQHVDGRAIAAIVVSVAGVGVLLGGDAWAGDLPARTMRGLGCAALATLTGAVCSVLYRPYLRRYGVARVSAVAMVASLPALALLAGIEGAPLPVTLWPRSTVALVVAIGLSSGVGYLLWLYALQRVSAGVATAFLALSPVTAVVVSAVALDTPPSPALAVASVLVVASLAMLAVHRNPDPGAPADGPRT